MGASDVGPDGKSIRRSLTDSIDEKTKHLTDRGVNPEHLGGDTTSSATRLNRINSMKPDTPSATPNDTSYHPHSGYHINTEAHAKMTKGLKDGESVHVPNPEAHHVDGVALGQSTGASSSGGILVSKHGIHPVEAHDPSKHSTSESHGPLTSKDVIAGHLGQQMHQLHEDNPEQSMTTAMHIPAGHPATSAVHGTDHPSTSPIPTTPSKSSSGSGIKAKLGYGEGGVKAQVRGGSIGAAADLGSSLKRFTARRGKGAIDRIATGVSDRAEGKSFFTGKPRPPSMTQKLHGYLQSKVPGYQPGMNAKEAAHTAFKTHGDNIKAASSMTSSAPAARAGATTSTPPPPKAGATAGKAPPKVKTPKPTVAKPKTAPIKTEAAPKVDSTKVKTPTPKIPTGPTDAEQTAATTAASTPTPGTPEILKSLFGGTEFEKMLTFMKSINRGKMSAAYWADKEKW